MVGACTPAACATARVVTACAPSSRSRRDAASTMLDRTSSRAAASVMYRRYHCSDTVDNSCGIPADEITVAVRDMAKAERFAERGVGLRRGDYADPGSLPGAFEGADQLLLVSSNDPGADAVSLHRAAI